MSTGAATAVTPTAPGVTPTGRGARSRRRRYGSRSVTRLGWWFLWASMILASLGLLRGDVWMYLVALLALATLPVSWFSVPRLPPLVVTLVAPDVEIVGTPTPARVVLRAGPSRIPRHHLTIHAHGDGARVEAVVEALAPGESCTLDVVLHPDVRGVHDERRTRHWTTAPFGLVRRSRTDAQLVTRTIAAGVDEARVAPASLRGDGRDGTLRVGRSGPDVHALRAWSPGDGTAIHWRTTARRGVPVVVDREAFERTGLVVVVGPASTPEGSDAVVARAAGIALRAAREGAEVRLVSSRGAESLAAHEADALLLWTVVADPVDPVTALAEQAASLAGAGGRVVVVQSQAPRSLVWTDAAGRHGAEVVEVEVSGRAPAPPRTVEVSAMSRPLAMATLASLAGGLLCLAVTGVLTTTGVLVSSTVLALAGVLGMLRPATFASPVLRSAASILIILVTGALAFHLADSEELAAAAAAAVCGVATAQMVSARTRRDGLVALGLGPVMVVTAAGFAPSPALVLPTMLVAVAVLLGLASAAQSSQDDALTTDGPAPSTALGRLALPVTTAVAVGVVTFLVLPLGSAPTLGTSLLGDRQHTQSPAEQAAEVTPSYFGGSMDLAARGHLPDTPAFTVAAGAPPLWRALTLDRVVTGSWFAAPMQQSLPADSQGRIQLPTDPAEAGAPARAVRDYEVRPADAFSIVSPGPASTVTGLDSVAQWQDNSFVLDSALKPYVVHAAAREDVDQLDAAGTGPDRTEPVFVSGDPATTQRTVELARAIVAGVTDRVARVQAVEDWLRTHVRYQLDAPLPPSGQDAVDFLLFDSHAGFCEHFAAAETILLRSLGIPSRLATGYSVAGDRVDAMGRLQVRDSDAHAWVEVWIPGHGWVTSDPTAGSALADAAASQPLVQRLLDTWNRLWATDSGRRVLALVLLGVGGVGLVVAVPVRRRRRASGVRRAVVERGASLEPLAAFARYRAALVADGHVCSPGDGVADVRRHAGSGGGDAALLGALDVVERTLYARTMPPSHVRLAAAELLDRRTAELTARRTPTPV